MNKLLAFAAVLGLAAASPAAVAKKPASKTKTVNYKTSLAVAGADGAYSAFSGRAKLQDHGRKDRLWVWLKGVQPGDVYTAKLYAGTCDARGDEVTGWVVKNKINANSSGNASGRLESRTFKSVATSPYAVVVSTPEGVELACGTFKAKQKPKKAKRAPKADSKAKGPKQS